ncbi:rRNA-processing protein [Microbotryomycetes sp. JL221]|nr:rRNA-processing protein [Microbotryomycetes sp. JL221]
MTSLISAVSWIPRGVAAQHPSKYVVDETELDRVGQLARVKLQDAQFELELARATEHDNNDDGDDDAMRGDDDDNDDDTGLDSNDDGPVAEQPEEDEWQDESDEEMKDATSKAKAAAKTIKAQATGATTNNNGDEDDLTKYNLDDYDNEESKGTAMGAFSNIKGLTFYGDNENDPYVTLETKQEDEELEREELEIYPTDNLLVCARTEDDVSQLEVYVYDDKEENLYVHHDLLLPAMPLCLEWLDFCPGKTNGDDAKGNFVAVGTLDPEIEIWSLDVVDGLYPDAILGPPPKDGSLALPASMTNTTNDDLTTNGINKKKKKKKAKKPKVVANAEYHVDSILSLSWNRSHRNLLASSSADKTVKLWDLSRPTSSPAVRSFDALHTDKIQAVQWNPKESTVLLSGSWDGSVRVFDSRAPEGGVGTKVMSDVECLRWDPWEPAGFLVSMENGTVQAYDSRTLSSAKDVKPSKALWTLAAHDASVSSLDINSKIKGCIVTGGTDNLVKVWNIDEQGSSRNISLVTARDLGVGKVFSASFCPDDATTLAVAGSKANLQIWDTSTNAGVRTVFGDRLKAIGKSLDKTGSGIVALQDDNDDVSDGDDDE